MKVIEPGLWTMRDKLRDCRDVEELVFVQTQSIASIQYQALLNEKVFYDVSRLTKLSTIHDSVTDILRMAISYSQKYLQVKGEVLSTKSDAKKHKRTSSMTDDEDVEPVPVESITETEFLEYVKHLDDRFLRAIPFIRSGLKASARAAEFPTLGILATRLEAGLRE